MVSSNEMRLTGDSGLHADDSWRYVSGDHCGWVPRLSSEWTVHDLHSKVKYFD